MLHILVKVLEYTVFALAAGFCSVFAWFIWVGDKTSDELPGWYTRVWFGRWRLPH